LQGLEDISLAAKPELEGAPRLATIPGVKAYLLPHDRYPYVIEIPAQEFLLNETPQRLHRLLAKAVIVKWQSGDKVFAYSYGLVPVITAHKENGHWVADSEVGCMFEATFIDDRGDGIFRILTPGTMTAEMVPSWARTKEN